MRSYLTRRIFQQLIREEPLIHAQCLRQPRLSGRQVTPSISFTKTPSRSIWFLKQKKSQRELKAQSIDPGMVKLREVENLLRMGARPPPAAEVVTALEVFFKAKKKVKKQEYKERLLEQAHETLVLDTQLKPLLAAFEHLQAIRADDKDAELSMQQLAIILDVLSRQYPHFPIRGQEDVVQLASLIYEDAKARQEDWEGSAATETDQKASFDEKFLGKYLRFLSNHGQGIKIRDILYNRLETDPLSVTSRSFWALLVRGLAREGKDKDIEAVLDTMQDKSIPFRNECIATIIYEYTHQGDIEKVKQWYRLNEEADTPTKFEYTLYVPLLRLCRLNNEFEWGQRVLNDLLKTDLNKECWDAVLQWAVSTGKGVDEIERMMNVMVKRTDGTSVLPDTLTINRLVEAANDRNDPYVAERLHSLAIKWNIDFDARTYILQMAYRLKHGDLEGARAAYNQVRSQNVENGEDGPILNELIIALCERKPLPFDDIMELVGDLTDHNGLFTPKLVATLSIVHLSREEFHDTIDLLQTHTAHFESAERALVRDAFVRFILSPDNSVGQAWDAYMILRQIFPEIDNPLRLKLMNHFFAQKRHDMAVHTFGHIRQSQHKDRRPDAAAYAECVEGLARARQRHSLDIVHNMLRLDSEVEPDTRLNAAFILAYAACDDSPRALEYWDEITLSREGPTYDSICIALFACQYSPRGEEQARAIWNRLQQMNVEISKSVADGFVAALAGQSLMEEAYKTVQDMQNVTGSGEKADIFSLCALCNSVRTEDEQKQVHEWTQSNYPDIWTRLKEAGQNEMSSRFLVDNLGPKPNDYKAWWSFSTITRAEADAPFDWGLGVDQEENEEKERD